MRHETSTTSSGHARGSVVNADDPGFMRRALELAERAAAEGEVPVGAVLVQDGAIVAESWNRPIAGNDPTAHAEIRVLREAGRRLGNYRLPGTVLYVTLEPCIMCAGAIVHARVGRLVYGAADPKTGAAGTVCDCFTSPAVNHRVEVVGGLLSEASAALLRAFFRARR